MPSVAIYEKTYDESLAELQQPSDDMLGIQDSILKDNGVNTANLEDNKPLMAAVMILEKQTCPEHPEYATGLASIIGSFTVEKELFLQKFQQDNNFRGLFTMAVAKKNGIDILNLSKLNQEQKDQLISLTKEERNSPSPEVQKLCMALYIENCINTFNLKLAKEGSFASYCFVVIKKLDLPISKDACQKIIDLANFSLGFLHMGTAKTRRAAEQVWLESRVLPTYQPPQTLALAK